MKTLNKFLIAIIIILLFMSFLALFVIHYNLSNLEFSFSPVGIENYLSAFSKYKSLFAGTVATCTVYMGLLRVKATNDGNREKLKQDLFNEWKTVVQTRSNEIEKYDPFMIREIIRIRRGLFNSLYVINFKIEEKAQLKEIFEKYVKNLISFFENQNNKYIDLGGIYPNNEHSYSFDSFRFLFYGMIDYWYDDMERDLKELYNENLDSNRTISLNLYQAASNNQL